MNMEIDKPHTTPRDDNDLVALIQQHDPEFNPEQVSDGNHPYKKVFDNSLYPETKLVMRGKSAEIKVLDTHVNLEWLLSLFGAKIRYNKMSWCREIEIPGGYIYKDDEENSAYALVDYIATLNDFPTKKLDQHLSYIAQKYAYHPVVEAIDSVPWDGVERLDTFARTLVSDQPYAPDVIKIWMTAALAAAYSEHGFTQQGVLVLQGEQNLGKTHWVKSLDPTRSKQAIKEGVFLDPGQKDSIIQMASYWMCELGELESIFKKSDIGRLKSYITMQFDHVRFPHARKPTRLPRRSAYVATVNDINFLADDTGNRRWWTIRVKEIIWDHGLDMQQVWAEVKAIWQNGYPTNLTPQLQFLINVSNTEHERIDPLEELVLTSYDWTSTERRVLSATEVLLELGYTKPSRSEATRMGAILHKLISKRNEQKVDRTNNKRGHFVPYKLFK